MTAMGAPAPPRHQTNLTDILNDEEPKPQLILDDIMLRELHRNLVSSTSGCSLEQLEQINAALMDAIWKHRAEYNRNIVLQQVKDSFNVIITDIQTMQQILKSSQEEEEAQNARYSGYVSTQLGLSAPSQDDWYPQTQTTRH